MYVSVARHRLKLYIKVVDICHTQINIYLDRQCSELEYLKTELVNCFIIYGEGILSILNIKLLPSNEFYYKSATADAPPWRAMLLRGRLGSTAGGHIRAAAPASSLWFARSKGYRASGDLLYIQVLSRNDEYCISSLPPAFVRTTFFLRRARNITDAHERQLCISACVL